MKKQTLYLFCAIGAFFLVLRLGILLTGVEFVSHYDELDLGTIARDLLTGLKLPFHFYQLDAYSGESLILGPMIIPFFKIFGHSLFAIKMVPLLFSFGSLLIIVYFLRKHFNDGAALRGALLYTAGIPVLTQLSLVGMAGHCESAFFGLLILSFFYNFMYSGKSWKSLLLFAAFSGFGVWFYYANAMMVAACLLSWLVLDRASFLSRRLAVFALTAAVFFSPWLILNLKSSFGGVQLLTEIFSVGGPALDLSSFIRKNASILIKSIPFSFSVTPSFLIHEKVLSLLIFVPLTILCVRAFLLKGSGEGERKSLTRKLLPLGIYVAVFFCVIFGSALNIVRHHGFVGYRYLTPLFITLIFLTAIAVRAAAARFLFSIILITGILGHLPLFFQEPFGRALAYHGYSYYQLGTRWRMSLPVKLFNKYEDFRPATLRFNPSDRLYLLLGMADMAIMDHDSVLLEESAMDVSEIIQQEPPLYGSFLYEWLGSSKLSTAEDMKNYLKDHPLSEKEQAYLCNGWLGNWEQAHAVKESPEAVRAFSFCVKTGDEANFVYLELSDDIWPSFRKSLDVLNRAEKNWVYRGLGRTFYLEERFSQVSMKRRYEKLFGQVSGSEREAFLEGIGWGIGLRFIDDKTRAFDWARKFPARDQEKILKGIQAFESWYGYP